ncbi:MAG: hypothetical protein K6T31_04770 [Alicyclobacillus sp.]|nr:hypothetical protein [Alicyclobacillus sp.]
MFRPLPEQGFGKGEVMVTASIPVLVWLPTLVALVAFVAWGVWMNAGRR